jgi:hypothetical protein
VLLATLIVALGAPAAHAAVTVDMRVSPEEIRYGSAAGITGRALLDGAPLAGQPVQLEGRRYPYDGEFRVLDEAVTAADGTYGFERELDRNWDLRVRVGDAVSRRERAYVFPAFALSFRARNSRVIRLTQRYRVPRGVRLEKPTIFYVARRGAARAARAATAELERIGAGRYRASTLVRIPSAWKGRFRYASCSATRAAAGWAIRAPRARRGSASRNELQLRWVGE